MKNLLTNLVLCLSIVLPAALTAQSNLPALVVDGSGSYEITTTGGATIAAAPGTSVEQGAKLHLHDGSVLILVNDQFTLYEDPGSYELMAEEASGFASLNFDPLFAQYLKATMSIVDQQVGNNAWNITMSENAGDGWSRKDPKADGDWGDRKEGPVVKGWGNPTAPNVKGWMQDNGGSSPNSGSPAGSTTERPSDWGDRKEGPVVKGWGDRKSGPVVKGWGDRTNSGAVKGWGLSNRYYPESGWGALWRETKSGWGARKNAQPVKGWGLQHPAADADWGDRKSGPVVKGWGTKKRNTIENGWTQDDMTIQPNQPGGLYMAGPVHLSWVEEPKTDQYMVAVFDEDLKLMSTAVTQDNEAVIDLSALQPGTSYYWQVYAHNRKAISPPTFFQVMAAEDYSDAQLAYRNSSIYDDGSAALQGVMRATSLEHNNLLMEAYREYDHLMEQYPHNDLVKYSYASYLTRAGLEAEVELLFK